MVIALPLGLTTAIYMGEIAPPWQREILKPIIEVLAGIPSIVLGFLGWIALAPLIQRLGAPTGLTAFTAVSYTHLTMALSTGARCRPASPSRSCRASFCSSSCSGITCKG